MKNLKLLLALFVCLAVMSCKNDERENEVTYNGQTFALNSGILTTFGSNGNGSFDWDVNLFGGNIVVDANGLGGTGSGPTLYMDLNTDSAAGLVSGTYTFQDFPREAFKMVAGDWATDFDIPTLTGDLVDIEGGTVDVEVGDNDYTFDFNFTDASGNSISGYYKGTLRSI